jgi:hypothetical protein
VQSFFADTMKAEFATRANPGDQTG